MDRNARTAESVRREAKAIARTGATTHSQALDMLARKEGFGHWGAYQARLTQDEGRAARTVSPVAVMKAMFPDTPLDEAALAGTRHLIVSGPTGTGKTTLLQGLLGHVPRHAPIVLLDRDRELTNPNPHDPPRDFAGIHDALGYSVERYMYAAFGDEAYRMPYLQTRETAGVMAFGEIDSENLGVVRQAMSDREGPSVFATLHCMSPMEAYARLVRGEEDGIHRYPRGEVVCVHLTRSYIGRRNIAEIMAI